MTFNAQNLATPIAPKDRWECTPYPGRKIWYEIVKGNMLVPIWDKDREGWVKPLSDSVNSATYRPPDGMVLKHPDGKVLRPPQSRENDRPRYQKPPPPQSSRSKHPPASSSQPRPAWPPPSQSYHSGPRKFEQPSPRYSSYDEYTPAPSSRTGGQYRDYR